MNQINCMKCKHFQMTYDAAAPYGCAYFKFKSKQTPSLWVMQSSGKKCQAYASKEVPSASIPNSKRKLSKFA